MQIFQELTTGSDRAAALIAAAELDGALEDAIASEWTNMEGSDREMIFSSLGPLSNIVAKVRIAHAMGIFGEITRDDLFKIAHIRNGFAHSSKPWSFDTDPVASECLSLKVLENYHRHRLRRLMPLYRKPRPPRGMFIDTCLAVISVLQRHTIREGKSVNAYLQKIVASLNADQRTSAKMKEKLRAKFLRAPP